MPSTERREPPTPRRVALEVLRKTLPPGGGAFAQDELEAAFRQAPMAPNDRRLAADISYGVIRRRATLDAVLAAYTSRPLREVEHDARHILRLGLYQLLFHARVPQYAALDECGHLARAVGLSRACGFINGVLRTITRDAAFSGQADAGRPRESLALTADRACTFGRPVLPPPAEHARHLAAACSYPHWLVVRWLARYGATRARELLVTGNEPPHLFVRPNLLRNSAAELLAHLREESVAVELSPSGRTLRLGPHTEPAALRCFREGRFLVQDDAAAAVAEFLQPQPGETVLDLCAAPGGKTCHLAERMRNEGRIMAVDISTARLARVRENAARMGHTIITTVAADGGDFVQQHSTQHGDKLFDRVLLDAPCSNTAVLRRRVEARWRQSDAALARLVRQETRLLEAALRALRPGGTLVYSTCSLEPEENGELVRAVLRRAPGFRLDAEEVILPSPDGGDGINLARLVRRTAGGGSP